LSALWLVFIAVIFIGALAGGFSTIQEEYENAALSSYESSAVTVDEVDVEVEPASNSDDEAAEAAQPPVDSAQE